ncbi:MAG: hypothetical protein K2O73_05065 [Lachnospiraceae bacterium]|nr:hypothetical protein [Lachnospiraceae bacterium]
MDKKRLTDPKLEERMKKLICQAQEAELALLEQDAEWLEQEQWPNRTEQELEELARKAEYRRKFRSIQKVAASIAAVVAILLLAANFQGVVQAAQELIQWVESYIDSHGRSDSGLDITTETEKGDVPEAEDGQSTEREPEQHVEDDTEILHEEIAAGESIGSLQTDRYTVIGEQLWIENAGFRQIIHFQKAERSYFEIWDTITGQYCGSFRTAHTEWDFDRGHWYVFSEDCNEDGKQDIVMLQTKAAEDGTVLSIEYFLQENGNFRFGGQAEYRTEQTLHTYRYGDLKEDLCYVSVKDDVIAISYVDQENDGQCFYARSEDGGVTWKQWDMRYENLPERPDDAVEIWHHDLGEGNACIILGAGANVGAGQKKTYIYSLKENNLTLLAGLDPPDTDYIRCCYFEDRERGYISYRYRTQPEPVVYRTIDGGAHWTKEEIELNLPEYAYGEVCAFRKESGRLLMDIYVSMNAQGEPEIQTIHVAEAAN